MDFETSSADEQFRLQVRSFIQSKLNELFPDRARLGNFLRPPSRETLQAWTRALDRRGWLVHHWPKAYGGGDWPATWGPILDDELVAADCPKIDMIGIGFVGPVIYTFGTAEQKARYLPRIRNADEFWCQGFSEAHGGSDAMSIRTTAVRRGDKLIINGQKLWTSNAHNADMMFALVRLDAPVARRQQPGLSFVLLNMHSPGVTVRPIITIDGRHWVNEVTLDNVEIPASNLVGEQGKGWLYARFLLANERTIVAGLPIIRRQIAGLKRMLVSATRQEAPLFEHTSFRLRVAQVEGELRALEFLELRLLHSRRDDAEVHRLAPILKLRGTELRQRISELMLEAVGERGLEAVFDCGQLVGAADDDIEYAQRITTAYLFERSATIAGGTSEIQRNIIAGLSLGM